MVERHKGLLIKINWQSVESIVSNVKRIFFVFYTFVALPVAIYGILDQGNTFIRWALAVILIFPWVWSSKRKW